MERKLSHSQNYFRNSEFVWDLVTQAKITKNDLVVEIGAGKGIITAELAKKAGKVIAVELDRKLYRELVEKFRGEANVEIVSADFMKWELPKEPYKVFANIPFNMTAEIINKLLYDQHPPKTAYLIMQNKAAERFVGQPVAQDTQTSILLKNEFEAEIILQINRREFRPIPRVDSVLIVFRHRNAPLVEPSERQLFRDLVVYGYNQWKPTVLEALEKVFSHQQRQKLKRVLGGARAKPRDLTIEQWVELFGVFVKLVGRDKKVLVAGAESKLKMQQNKLQKVHRTR